MSEMGLTGGCLTFVFPFNFVCVEVHFKCSRPEDLYNKCDILCANTCTSIYVVVCVCPCMCLCVYYVCVHICTYVHVCTVHMYVLQYLSARA